MATCVNSDNHSFNLVDVHVAKKEVMMVTFEQILELLQDIIDDESATSETKNDAKQLYNQIFTYDFVSLLGFWNKILICIHRV